MNRILDHALTTDEIVSHLKKQVQFKDIYTQIQVANVIHAAAKERNITVTSDEVQTEADRMRHQKKLEKASDTLAWLASEGITVDDWEAGIRDRLLAEKLAEDLFAQDIAATFARTRLDYDQVLVYQIVVDSEQLAQELLYQLEEKELSFYEAAHLYNINLSRRLQCGYDGLLYRANLHPELAATIFAAAVGSICGPIKTEQGYHLLLVEEFVAAELTPAVRQKILKTLFDDWLQL